MQRVSADARVFTRVACENMFRHERWDPAIKIGDFRYEKEHCKVGGLLGNRFSLCLRDIGGRGDLASGNGFAPSDQCLDNMVQSLQKTGFINFFGHQRFGTGNRSSHLCGLELLKGNYEDAVSRFIEHNVKDSLSVLGHAAYKEGDFKAALHNTPANRRSEHKIFSHLVANPKDFKGAIMNLPRTARLLLVRTYTSFLFNKLTKIIKI